MFIQCSFPLFSVPPLASTSPSCMSLTVMYLVYATPDQSRGDVSTLTVHSWRSPSTGEAFAGSKGLWNGGPRSTQTQGILLA